MFCESSVFKFDPRLGETETSELLLSLIVCNDYYIDQTHRHIGNAPPDVSSINSKRGLKVGTHG